MLIPRLDADPQTLNKALLTCQPLSHGYPHMMCSLGHGIWVNLVSLSPAHQLALQQC